MTARRCQVTAGLLTLSSTAMRMQQRQALWRSALQIAEDEVALLSAKPELPPLGIHPLDDELLQFHPLAAQGEIEVKPGNSDRLREIRITFRLRGDGLDKDIQLAAILPANPSPSASPSERAAPTPRPGEANIGALPGASVAEAIP